MTRHPLERAGAPALLPSLVSALVLTLAVAVPLLWLDAGLRSASAPHGIVSFELAGARGAAAVLAGWTSAQRLDAALVQGLDMLFLLAYSTALACGALLLGRRQAARAWVGAAGRWAAWAASGAALADVIENVALIQQLRAGAADPARADLAAGAAWVKFALLALVLGYLVLGAGLPRLGARSGG